MADQPGATRPTQRAVQSAHRLLDTVPVDALTGAGGEAQGRGVQREGRVEVLDGGRALPWQLDGDRMEPTRALDLSLRPAALRIVGP